jgi:hypothetical protein
MVAKTPKSIKTKVISEWLQESSRNKIAENFNRPETTAFRILTNEEACSKGKERGS